MADDRSQRPFRVAVASDAEGERVQRFGHATLFLVYDILGGECFLVESRTTAPACGSGAGRHDERLEAMARVIDDCDAVLVREIGPGAVAALQRRSVYAHTGGEYVDEAIATFAAARPRPPRPTYAGAKND